MSDGYTPQERPDTNVPAILSLPGVFNCPEYVLSIGTIIYESRIRKDTVESGRVVFRRNSLTSAQDKPPSGQLFRPLWAHLDMTQV